MAQITPSPCLLIADALGKRLISIENPTLTIGRRIGTDVRVVEPDVSRVHAKIITESGRCTVYDCSSRFGTFVNDERTTARALAHGDRIRLGRSTETEIVFFLLGDPSSAERTTVSAAGELRHMAGLLEGLHALGSGRVLEDVLALVVDCAIDVTGAERGFIMLANRDDQLEFRLARAEGRSTLPGQLFAISRKIPETVFDTGKTAIVDDLLDEHVASLHSGTVAIGIRRVLCVPLRLTRFVEEVAEPVDDRVIGVLYLDSQERVALGSESVRSALETLSREAAVAIENARLYRESLDKAKYEQELKVAAAIQQGLLPASGHSGAFFTVAAASVPCRAVGGDFFDYVDFPAGQFGFFLGDVAGKGSPAALLAAAALGMFSIEATYQQSAATLLARLNRAVFRRQIEARFLTAFYGILDRDGRFSCSSAGHNPPLLLTADGVARLETGGTVLGLFEKATFDEETLMLNPGDVVVAFSDGVTEAHNATGEEFGDARLVACAETHRPQAPQAILDALLGEVRSFCDGVVQNDDVTIIVMRYDG